MSNIFEPYIDSSDHKRRLIPADDLEVGFEEAMTDEDTSAPSTVLKRETKAFSWFMIFVFVVFGALSARAAYLQIIENESYEVLAEGNRNRIVPILAPRGIIYDRNDVALVKNEPSFDAAIIPVDLPDEDAEVERVLRVAADTLELSFDELFKTADEAHPYSFEPIIIKEDISREQALILEADALTLPGLSVEKTSVRSYPQNQLLSHELGYVGKITAEELERKEEEGYDYLLYDSIGKAGIEQSYENLLRGNHGKEQVEVDSRGGVVNTLATKEPDPGKNVVLTIDEGLQRKLYEELAASADRANVKKGAAVAIDPRDGGILAMVNLPSYDNNLFTGGISQDEYNKLLNDEARPLNNKASSGIYPPGSTFKPFVAAAALEDGLITPETTITSTGKISIGSFNFYDYDLGGHGVTDLNKAIAKSVNTYFYYIGGGYQDFRGLGIDKMTSYISRFGLGDYVGVDIAAESTGLLPTPEWKEQARGEQWFIGDTYNASIGQGDVSVTPLQLATAYVPIANEGTLFRPHFLKESFGEDPSVRKSYTPEIIRDDVMSKETLKSVKRAMRETVISGSGRSLEPLGIEAGGKTGTAQFVIPNSGGEKGEHAWFATFAPVSDPKIVLVVLVEGAGEGHQNAVPVAREALDWYFNKREKTND